MKIDDGYFLVKERVGVRIADSVHVHTGDFDVHGLADQSRQICEGPVGALGPYLYVPRPDAVDIDERFDAGESFGQQFLDERLRAD